MSTTRKIARFAMELARGACYGEERDFRGGVAPGVLWKIMVYPTDKALPLGSVHRTISANYPVNLKARPFIAPSLVNVVRYLFSGPSRAQNCLRLLTA